MKPGHEDIKEIPRSQCYVTQWGLGNLLTEKVLVPDVYTAVPKTTWFWDTHFSRIKPRFLAPYYGVSAAGFWDTCKQRVVNKEPLGCLREMGLPGPVRRGGLNS